jgi:hypothetical protein
VVVAHRDAAGLAWLSGDGFARWQAGNVYLVAEDPLGAGCAVRAEVGDTDGILEVTARGTTGSTSRLEPRRLAGAPATARGSPRGGSPLVTASSYGAGRPREVTARMLGGDM